MKILKDQTLYQCSYCSKRLLTKAGAKLHENNYCKSSDSPHGKNKAERIKNCQHENTATSWRLILGEHGAHEPEFEYCVDCGAILY